MPQIRVTILCAAALIVAAACSPAATAAPGATTASTPAGGPTGAPASVPAATTAATTAPTTASSADQVCSTAATLETALARLKALDPAKASQADLEAAVHDVGQAGATLIVMGAKAEHLQALNIGAQLTSSMVSRPNATASEKIQVVAQFANTAQAVLDELVATCG